MIRKGKKQEMANQDYTSAYSNIVAAVYTSSAKLF